jgi:hypothetical protein
LGRRLFVAIVALAAMQTAFAPDASFGASISKKGKISSLSTQKTIKKKLAALALAKKTKASATAPTTATSASTSPSTSTPPPSAAASAATPALGTAASTAWTSVAGYQLDFKPGGPATGWTYAWNPTGKLGNFQAFTPLAWSNTAQAYNTTGAATMLPAKNTTHNDDYLMLQASGGHPGKPNYMPVIGYTIQPDDGAGHYRLSGSSIAKWDGILSSNEDGLAVYTYLNNTLLTPSRTVATNGLVTNFDRDLGQLNVGDKIWLAISPLKNQYFDGFHNFDFTVQRLTSITPIPEPGTATLLVTALAACCWRGRRRGRA